jgi:hypothetical protein
VRELADVCAARYRQERFKAMTLAQRDTDKHARAGLSGIDDDEATAGLVVAAQIASPPRSRRMW